MSTRWAPETINSMMHAFQRTLYKGYCGGPTSYMNRDVIDHDRSRTQHDCNYLSAPCVHFPVVVCSFSTLQLPPFPPLPRAVGKRFSLSPVFARPSVQKVDIPVLVIRNETGQRMLEEILEKRREVVLFSHAGGRPSRLVWRQMPPRNAHKKYLQYVHILGSHTTVNIL